MGQQEVYIAPPPPRSSRNWSCCLWGCLVAFILFVLLSIALVLIGRTSLTALRENYTSSEPEELPTVQIEESALDALVARVDTFADHVEKKEPASPLVLSQDDLNALIQHHPKWRDLHDKVYVEIDQDLVKGMVNIPLTGIPLMSGRYLHGSVTFIVSLQDGRLEVYVDSAVVNGEPLPDEIMTGIRRENLAQTFLRDNPGARDVVDQLESIRIEGGKVIVSPKQVLDAEQTPAEAETPESATPVERDEAVPEVPATVEQPEEPTAAPAP